MNIKKLIQLARKNGWYDLALDLEYLELFMERHADEVNRL